ncbi:MAG: hypothetical protein WC553_02410 [Patescibacteria group bacterium]
MSREGLTIPRPTLQEVERYLKPWGSQKEDGLKESSLNKLFLTTYPLNNNLDDILIKVCSLNVLYSTNILDPLTVARHIQSLGIDEGLKRGDLGIVNQIATVKMNGGKTRRFYSFATKYCSRHQPKIYPIYDSYVEKLLLHFKRTDQFAKFSNQDLKDYPKFREIIDEFRTFYGLTQYDPKTIDQYLWQAGKEYYSLYK